MDCKLLNGSASVVRLDGPATTPLFVVSMSKRQRSLLLPCAILATVLGLTTVRVTARQLPLAWLSDTLQQLLRLEPLVPVRVIVEGDVATLRGAAARLGIPIVRTLDKYIVVRADAAQVTALQREPAVKSLNPDLAIAPTMAVADKTVGGDLTRAGSTGLLGLVQYPGVTGKGIGVAILRYRLYDIDRIVSRTIGYAAVTGVLGVVFVGTNLVLQAILAPLVRADTIVVAGSTLLVAALFSPVRARIQQTVDRRFHRARHDADRLAARLADGLRDEVDLAALRARTVEAVDAAVEPVRTALWLRERPSP